MLEIAVCDDEEYFLQEIKVILQGYLNDKGVMYNIDTFKSGEEFLSLGIELLKYKIVFLDISMNDINGIAVAKKIREINNQMYIVFVTAYATYAFDGYKVEAIRYILKNNQCLQENIFECMDVILYKMKYTVQKKTFNFNEGTTSVSLDYLLYIESRLHKLYFYVIEDKVKIYTLYGTLNQLEKEFENTEFLRIHQSYFVNMKHIVKMNKYKAFLTNDTILSIPRTRYKDVEKAFIEYKGEV